MISDLKGVELLYTVCAENPGTDHWVPKIREGGMGRQSQQSEYSNSLRAWCILEALSLALSFLGS